MGKLLSPLFRWVNWGTESLSNVLWITQLVRGRNEIPNQIVWLEGLYFSPSVLFFSNWLQGPMSVVLILATTWNHLRNFKKYQLHDPPAHVRVTQSCPTLCDSTDCSLPGSSLHGILQARILQWVASPGGLPDPRIKLGSPVLQQILYHLKHQGSPHPPRPGGIRNLKKKNREFS